MPDIIDDPQVRNDLCRLCSKPIQASKIGAVRLCSAHMKKISRLGSATAMTCRSCNNIVDNEVTLQMTARSGDNWFVCADCVDAQDIAHAERRIVSNTKAFLNSVGIVLPGPVRLAVVEKAFRLLTTVERRTIKLLWGLETGDPLSFEDVGTWLFLAPSEAKIVYANAVQCFKEAVAEVLAG